MLTWLSDAWEGFRIMLAAGALNLPAMLTLAFTLGSTLAWFAAKDWYEVKQDETSDGMQDHHCITHTEMIMGWKEWK